MSDNIESPRSATEYCALSGRAGLNSLERQPAALHYPQNLAVVMRRQCSAPPTWQHSVCGRAAPEAENVAIGILDIKVLRAPSSLGERLEDPCAVRCAPIIERFDARNTSRGI